jgi:hypothetical protein
MVEGLHAKMLKDPFKGWMIEDLHAKMLKDPFKG